MGKARALLFVELEGGCQIPLSHRPNKDGYFRKRWADKAYGKPESVFFHRAIYEEVNGSIPSGYEIDHMCRNRMCQNPKHLQAIECSAHTVKTNKERSDDKRVPAEKLWREHNNTGTSLAKQFDVDVTTACRWIREWKRCRD